MNRQAGFSWAAVLFLLPFATAFLVFVGPTFFGLGMSFFDWEMLSGLPPAGSAGKLSGGFAGRTFSSFFVGDWAVCFYNRPP